MKKCSFRKFFDPRLLGTGAVVLASTIFGVGIGSRLNTPLHPPQLITPAYAAGAAEGAADVPADSRFLRETSANFRAIAKRVGPAVVVVTASQDGKRNHTFSLRSPHPSPLPPDAENQEDFQGFEGDPFWQFFQGYGRPDMAPAPGPGPGSGPRGGQSLGSGFIIDKKGYIVTNNHVVEGASKVTVALPDDDNTEVPATVVGRDPKTDLAVLKIVTDKTLPVAEWADSDRVEVGDWAVAIGSPFMLSHSVTSGIVSAKGRNASHLMGSDYGFELIQTDAAINPGNSGGPLCALDGKVMGVNTAIYTQSGGYMGIGFAIPSNLAKQITETLIRDGKVTRGWLGVAIAKAEPQLLKDVGLKSGVVVHSVQPDGPAGRAGLSPGDIISDVNGHPVKDASELQRAIAAESPGKNVTLKVTAYQTKKTSAVPVTLGDDHAVETQRS